MREAAQWLITTDRSLWPLDTLTAEALGKKCRPEEIFIGYFGEQAAVAALIQKSDAFLWPDDGHALYLHKLSVRRAFAGQGLPAQLFAWAEARALAQGRTLLRLDCAADRPKLCAFYEAQGFTCMSSRQFGPMAVALYEKSLTRPQIPA